MHVAHRKRRGRQDWGRTHLLELELSSPTHVGIGREGCYDATPHDVGIHSGKTKEAETGGLRAGLVL